VVSLYAKKLIDEQSARAYQAMCMADEYGARANKLGLKYLAGKKLGDLVDAEARATAQTLFKNGRPVRQIHLEKVDEFHLGALMMHFMLETILAGHLLGVDPFNQPAVESGKILTRRYLEN